MTTIPIGTIRVKVKGLCAYQKTTKSWKKCSQKFPQIQQIVKLFKAHKNLKFLIDKKDSTFLKGQLGPKCEVQGARINILPDGEILDKAYSLFAENLTVHDQSTDDHWDVIYQNKGGTFAYCYTLDKISEHRNRKYRKVWEFDKVYNKLFRSVSLALKNKEDNLAVPIFTLLRTHMRVGNEIYHRAHGHKGLTTLKKKDISIKRNMVAFNYLAKDGVPRLIAQEFPTHYVKRLKLLLKSLKSSSFVFTSRETGRPLPEHHFKKAFLRYCGKEFYPHIVRSHYATTQVKQFLNSNRRATKEEVKSLYLGIAADLGHKKFVKKEHVWKENYTVTINHYVQPELVERVKKIVK